MSAIKNLLEELNLEMKVNLELIKAGLTIEDVDSYDRAGGTETFNMWAFVHSYDLIEKWVNNYDGDGTDKNDLDIQCGVYVLKHYIDWLKTF